jgi:hypothetical protein
VPVASSFWIMASMGSLALCIRRCSDQSSWVRGLLAGPAATLGLMNVPFMALFHPLVTFAGLHASYVLLLRHVCCMQWNEKKG